MGPHCSWDWRVVPLHKRESSYSGVTTFSQIAPYEVQTPVSGGTNITEEKHFNTNRPVGLEWADPGKTCKTRINSERSTLSTRRHRHILRVPATPRLRAKPGPPLDQHRCSGEEGTGYCARRCRFTILVGEVEMITMKTLGLAIGIAFAASSFAFAQQGNTPANAAASGGAGTHQNTLRTGSGASTQKVQRNQQGYRQAARVRSHPRMRMQARAVHHPVHHPARLRPHPLHHMSHS